MALWLIARPFFGAADDLVMGGALRVPAPSVVETDGWQRLRVAPEIARSSRVRNMDLQAVPFAVCAHLSGRGLLEDHVYRVDVAFDRMIRPGAARPIPFSIPVADGQCADPTDPVRTRLVYPDALQGWELTHGGVVDLIGEKPMRFVSFSQRDEGVIASDFPFEMACDFLIEDRVARQFLYSIRAALPEAGSLERFAIGVDRGQAAPVFRAFEYGVQSCREVRV